MTKLQKVLLMMIIDIDKLLTENGIPYYLDGGSALGAVRHKGFIPWDDDLDICIMPEYYQKFVTLCRTKLNKEKYTFEEGEVDWPLPFAKIKLNGTTIEEVDAYSNSHKGIYIDIFCPDFAKRTKIGKFIQFVFGRLYVACFLARKNYSPNSTTKRIMLRLAQFINRSPIIYTWLRNQVRGGRKSDQLSMVWDRTRPNWDDYFTDKNLFESSVLMEFEGYKLPVCQGYDKYLTQLYGDYMQLPPENKRVGLHIIKIDYGKYDNIES